MRRDPPFGRDGRPVICLVTDRRRLQPPGEGTLIQLVAAAARSGVALIHVRERDLDDRRLLALTSEIVAVTRGTGASVVVNDRLDVALASGASGVHLRADSVDPASLRSAFCDAVLVGRSVHSAAEAVAAEASGADYLVFGTVFTTLSKPGGSSVAGPAGLQEACTAVRIPVLGIGGITADNAAAVARAGGAGIAAIGLFSDLTAHDHGEEALEAALTEGIGRVRREFAAAARDH